MADADPEHHGTGTGPEHGASARRARNVLPDLAIPAIALAFTAYYLSTITEVPWIAQASAVTVASLLVLSIAAYLVRTAVRVRRGVERLAVPRPHAPSAVSVRRLALLALTVAFVAVIDTLGFSITTSAFLFLAILTLSSPANWRAAALTAVGAATLGYIVFIHFFETRFPRGPIENWLRGWL